MIFPNTSDPGSILFVHRQILLEPSLKTYVEKMLHFVYFSSLYLGSIYHSDLLFWEMLLDAYVYISHAEYVVFIEQFSLFFLRSKTAKVSSYIYVYIKFNSRDTHLSISSNISNMCHITYAAICVAP